MGAWAVPYVRKQDFVVKYQIISFKIMMQIFKNACCKRI